MSLAENFKVYVLNRFAASFNQKASAETKRIDRITKEAILLLKDGFEYDMKNNVFYKQTYIDGRYEGEYDMEIVFPTRFPERPPLVFMKPKFKGKVSKHVNAGLSGDVCIEGQGFREGWWTEDMNVMSAVKLAIMVANEEIDKRAPKQIEAVSIKGTIFEDISKTIPKKDFIDFCCNKGIKIYHSWNWKQIAAKTQYGSINFKKEMVRLLDKYKNGNKN